MCSKMLHTTALSFTESICTTKLVFLSELQGQRNPNLPETNPPIENVACFQVLIPGATNPGTFACVMIAGKHTMLFS